MNTKNDIENNSEELSPTLLRLKNNEPFKTPLNYFDTVLPSVQNKIKQPTANNYPLLNHIKWTVPFTIAASIALLLIFKLPTNNIPALQPLNDAELYAAVNTYYFDDIDESMIEDNLLADNINTNLNSNEMIDYLIDNDEGDILNNY